MSKNFTDFLPQVTACNKPSRNPTDVTEIMNENNTPVAAGVMVAALHNHQNRITKLYTTPLHLSLIHI